MNIVKSISKYYILLILFMYLIGMSYLFTYSQENSFMFNLMGLFFIIFSFFKIIHLHKFKKSFSRYDIFSKIIPYYGYFYPFIEILLGSLFIVGMFIDIIAIITILVLSSTTVGVINTLRRGEIIECACLGVVFGIPLSHVTVFENAVMIIMAILAIL